MTPTNEGLSARLRARTRLDVWKHKPTKENPGEGSTTWHVPDELCVEAADALDAKDKLLAALTVPRPQSEWTEEDGDVLWWHYPIQEPPYCGSMLDFVFNADWHQWWTELPDGNAMEAAIRAKAGDL